MIKCICGQKYPQHAATCLSTDNKCLRMHFKDEVKNRYYQARYDYYLRTKYEIVKDGMFFTSDFPKVKTANGLTKFICNFLLWSAHHGERTNNMGRPIEKTRPQFNIFSGKVEHLANGIEWQKGTGIKGSSDIKGHINNANHKFPIPIYIEVKINKDSQSDEQKKYEQQVTKTGALYCIVKTPEDFFAFYDYCLSL